MADAKDHLTFRALCKHKNINAKLINTYIDAHYFFDYIGEGDKFTITFCRVNRTNQARYTLLCNINETINTPLFERSVVDVFDYDDQTWFMEIIPKYAVNYLETPVEDINQLLSEMDELNANIVSTADKETIRTNNLFYVDYFHSDMIATYTNTRHLTKHTDRIFSSDLYANFGDMEKTLEMSRVKYNGRYVFCGLQSLLPLPAVHGKINAIIFASMANPHIAIKLGAIGEGKAVGRIIEALRQQANQRPDYYTYDANRLIKHLKWLEMYYE